MATWSKIVFQDSSSPLMEQLSFFHVLIIVIVISVVVGYFMMYLLNNKLSYEFMLHGHMIESIWTLLPALTLIFITLLSIRMLYLIDDTDDALITIETIGSQWYWSYEYSDFKNIEFDSYMLNKNDLESNNFRLVDVDNRIIMPMNIPIHILTTDSDILHSWTVPSIGIKLDATPGQPNQANLVLTDLDYFMVNVSNLQYKS